MRQRIWQMGVGESHLCAALAWNGFICTIAAENAECQNQNSGIVLPAKMYESIPCKIWTLWFSFQWRFQRHIVWSSLLHSSSRCPIWVVVTVYIHRILCTYLLFVIKVIFPIDLFFPFFCWFCFNYRHYDIQIYKITLCFFKVVLRHGDSSFIHMKWICVLVLLLNLLSFVDFVLVIVTTTFKFIR